MRDVLRGLKNVEAARFVDENEIFRRQCAFSAEIPIKPSVGLLIIYIPALRCMHIGGGHGFRKFAKKNPKAKMNFYEQMNVISGFYAKFWVDMRVRSKIVRADFEIFDF